MILTEIITINNKLYTRTWSDINMMIERDGAMYEEAIDPTELGRVYTETNQEIFHLEDEISYIEDEENVFNDTIDESQTMNEMEV